MSKRHAIRFVRALVLASGVSSLGASCGRAELVVPGSDAGPTPIDAGRADAGQGDAGRLDAGLADAGGSDAGPFTCAACSCFIPDSGLPECTTIGHLECCPAIGPLAPPNLPA